MRLTARTRPSLAVTRTHPGGSPEKVHVNNCRSAPAADAPAVMTIPLRSRYRIRAQGWIRTTNHQVRNLALYPLSYLRKPWK
jgi:hypothetical protein